MTQQAWQLLAAGPTWCKSACFVALAADGVRLIDCGVVCHTLPQSSNHRLSISGKVSGKLICTEQTCISVLQARAAAAILYTDMMQPPLPFAQPSCRANKSKDVTKLYKLRQVKLLTCRRPVMSGWQYAMICVCISLHKASQGSSMTLWETGCISAAACIHTVRQQDGKQVLAHERLSS